MLRCYNLLYSFSLLHFIFSLKQLDIEGITFICLIGNNISRQSITHWGPFHLEIVEKKKYYPCHVSMIDFHYMVADENKYGLNSAPIYWDEIIFDKIEYSKYSKARKWHQKQVLAFSHILNFFQKKLWLKSKWSMLCSNLITISFTVKGKIGLLPGQLYNNLTWTAISPKWDNTHASFFQYSSWSPCYCNVIVLFRSLRDCICFHFLL